MIYRMFQWGFSVWKQNFKRRAGFQHFMMRYILLLQGPHTKIPNTASKSMVTLIQTFCFSMHPHTEIYKLLLIVFVQNNKNLKVT